jgi:CO/xanthine dehydrogenase Mo-binding subunit
MTPFEPERYELLAGPAYNFPLDRRGFFKTLGGGIVVASFLPQADAQESGGGRRGGQSAPKEISAWLHIDRNGAVTAYTGKVEVGQNARTSLTQAVAEELGAPMSAIEMVMGDTGRTPFDAGTFGSMTTPQMIPQLRKAAAAARQLLPAGNWKSIDFSKIDESLSGSTAAGAMKPTAEWKVLGTSPHKVHGRDIVTGRHQYTPDIKVPGMVFGRVLRPERFNSKLVSLDASALKTMAGVTVVEDKDFVGITAPTPAAAAGALAVLKAEWNAPQQTSSKTLYSDLRKTRAGGGGRGGGETGSVEKAMAEADKKLETTYTVAYIAHAPLEPRAAVASWSGDRLTVWTGTQRPFGVRSELAQSFHIPEDHIRVIMPDTGSGYGGKHTGEAAVEAARLAKSAGKPVKLVWTREEEFTWAYFRPAGVIDVRSAIDKTGRLTAWEFHNYNSGTSAINTLYDVPNKKIEFHPVDAPLRSGSYRGLAGTANHFARESHMDEMAALAGVEPLEFRLRNLKDDRLRAVLQAAADRFGWGKSKGSFGIAGGFEKGSYVATCAEVRVEPGKPTRVVRVVQAYECGAVVNPDQLRNQNEGAVIMGLGGALFESISFENGKILNPHFAQYRVPRFRDVPKIDIVLVDRKDLPPAGAGETPIMTLAPAIANAIYSATGTRLRSMPLYPGGEPQPAQGGSAV